MDYVYNIDVCFIKNCALVYCADSKQPTCDLY